MYSCNHSCTQPELRAWAYGNGCWRCMVGSGRAGKPWLQANLMCRGCCCAHLHCRETLAAATASAAHSWACTGATATAGTAPIWACTASCCNWRGSRPCLLRRLGAAMPCQSLGRWTAGSITKQVGCCTIGPAKREEACISLSHSCSRHMPVGGHHICRGLCLRIRTSCSFLLAWVTDAGPQAAFSGSITLSKCVAGIKANSAPAPPCCASGAKVQDTVRPQGSKPG